jgi:SAM-dependent methyltransferase
VAEFTCNACGKNNPWSGAPFEREKPGCTKCGSTLRTRALLGALSMELFGTHLPLTDFPRIKSLRGLGTSDSSQYARRLGEVFDYRNTFYDREPRFDWAHSTEPAGSYDFVLSSDVLEHVAPPDDLAFRNAFAMLKPGGVLVFTVPYDLEESTEHFPELYQYGLAEVGDSTILVNRTRTGQLQVSENLVFHRNGTGRSLEMRVYSEQRLRDTLYTAGFTSVKIYSESTPEFGIVPAEAWSLPVAARKGPFACGIDAMRDVMQEWYDLKKAVRRPLWHRVARRLGVI